ncbi:MAG: SDR family NAD(P)-dependent oxidoreductase [Betaproteobacteria bacterium]|nr:SDR family NAD(P)-dependent oxidoreductase [Betaproteobacteria bacterium]
MDLELKGLTALVTGASRGIGLAIAQGLAHEGCNLHLVSRTADDLATASASIRGRHKVSVACHALDMSKSESAPLLAQRCGNVDILINNAGSIPAGHLKDLDEAQWRDGWELKVFGYINLTREIYRRMCARRRGVIVNVIGVAGERLRQDYIAGGTGNAALMAFTKNLGGESVDCGVRVVGVNPGQVETDRLRQRLERKAQAELGEASRWRELVVSPPFGRLARSEEVADTVVYLASSRASYISGTIVTVDGGRAVRHAT